ncbi:UBA/TS-N domain containing protein [Histomonas meleagridis]|nr:UBA/TS-N domain containing protein [Histomonas meleagridis]
MINSLRKRLANVVFSFVRWILLSCRSHLIRLPPEMEIPMFKGSAQFMALVSSSEAESAFQSIKQQFGEVFIFPRYILCEGLEHIVGIFADEREQLQKFEIGQKFEGDFVVRNREFTNWKRSNSEIRSAKQRRNNAAEVSSKGAWTRTATSGRTRSLIEEACVVRFVMVGGSFSVDVKKNPPKNVPSLRSVLDYQMNQSIN